MDIEDQFLAGQYDLDFAKPGNDENSGMCSLPEREEKGSKDHDK